MNDESVIHTLHLLHPKLEAQLRLSKQVAILEALRELETYDAESLECLLPEYRHILKNEKELLAQYKRQPAHLDRLYGNILLYIIPYLLSLRCFAVKISLRLCMPENQLR